MPQASLQSLPLSQTICRLFAECESARRTAPVLLQSLCDLAPYDAVEVWLEQASAPRCLYVCGTGARRRLDVEGGFVLLAGAPGEVCDELARDVATFLIRRTLAEEDAGAPAPLLRRVQRLTDAGYWIRYLTDHRLEWSEQVYRIFGRDPAEFTPTFQSFMTCVHPDDRPKVLDVIASGAPGATAEYRVVRPDGAIVVVETRYEVECDADGNRERLIGTVQDVTASRRADAMLFELSSAVEQSADHVMITDRDGIIEYVNPAFESVTGYTRAELAGLTPRILRSDAHRPDFYETMWRTILGGEVFREVFINRAKDGHLLYEEKTIAPIRNRDGAITHFVSTGRDITERRLAERQAEELTLALENIAREWRQTFDTIDMPILVVDGASVIRRVNRAAQQEIGAPFDAIVGIPIDELPRCEPWESARELARCSSPGQPSSAIRTSDPESQRSWEVASIRGQPNTIFVARDVTTIARLQESLRKTEVMSKLGAIVAGVAHEVRNPLFGISATIDALEAQPGSGQSFRPFMRRLRGELDRLNGLMVELLEYGRPGDRELAPSRLAMPLLDAARTLEPLSDSLSVRVGIDVSSGADVMVMADAPRLQLAFRNLLENAIQHAGNGGYVEAAAVRTARGIEVSVCDGGPGFPEIDLPHLFDPFFTRRPGGTGLGLSIVQRVVEQHCGTIEVANRESGGAIVRVTLPVIRT